MKLRYVALAAAVVFSAPAFAAPTPASTFHETTDENIQQPLKQFFGATYVNPTSKINNVENESLFSLAVSGTYSFWMAGLSNTGAVGLFSAVLSDGLGNTIKELTYKVSGETPYYAQYWDNLSLAAGDYKISIMGSHFRAETGFTAAAAGVQLDTVAVPGPEAGAGIGALALGGMALYLKRRRKEDAATA